MIDVLSVEGIRTYLGTTQTDTIHIYPALESTNVELKGMARDGASHGTVVLAETQTAGRGRMGREFYSPKHTGIYMSILVRPKLHASDLVLLTTATAVAVCRGICKLYSVDPTIKWVNDIYLKKRKICGILAEAVTSPDIGKIDAVVVGIGINLRTQDFPEELKEVAASIEDDTITENVSRNTLVAAVIDEFWKIYEHLTERSYMEEYRQRSNVLGKEVRFLENEMWQEAKAVDVDDDGGLIVEYVKENGERLQRTLHTGEITLRVK